jgi:hypothetical protein
MKLRRRQIEVFSLSFLDCICCGFGAIILLLVLTEFGKPVADEKTRKSLEAQQVALQSELDEIRGETDELNRQMPGRIDELQKNQQKLAHLAGDLTNIRGQFAASKQEASVTNTVQSELVSAYQTLTAEMQRLLKAQARRPKTEAVGGIPIDSEYIILVVDTSASMNTHWELAVQVIREILSLYPHIKGLQVMNDQGRYMFDGTRGQWLADTPERRDQIVKRMKNWRPFSQSNPVPGMVEAVRTFWAPDKRISAYVLGDEFTGDSIQDALDQVAKLNKPDASGRRVIRIHAIGYMNARDYPPFTNIRFSALMRMICSENNGAFVALPE